VGLTGVQESCTLEKLRVKPMATETSYTELRQNLAAYLDRVVDDREVIVVKRRGARDVAIIAADELAGLDETAHLLRSPANAKRLLESLRELDRGKGKTTTIEGLRRSVGLEKRR
jgi:antitoxin YefM